MKQHLCGDGRHRRCDRFGDRHPPYPHWRTAEGGIAGLNRIRADGYPAAQGAEFSVDNLYFVDRELSESLDPDPEKWVPQWPVASPGRLGMSFLVDTYSWQPEEYYGKTPSKCRPRRPSSNAKLLRWGGAGTIEIMSMNALLDRGLFCPAGWRRGLLGRRVRRGL